LSSHEKVRSTIQRQGCILQTDITDGEYYEEAWKKFCHEIGWQEKGEYVSIKYLIKAPKGHLPTVMTTAITQRNQIDGAKANKILDRNQGPLHES
jgi:hypothetical protein